MDAEIRAAAIERVRQLRDLYGGRIPRSALMEGITIRGERIPIWNYQKDNLALERAMLEQRPIIYLVAVDPGFYDAVLPVYVAGASDATLEFTLLADQTTASAYASDPIKTAARRESSCGPIAISSPSGSNDSERREGLCQRQGRSEALASGEHGTAWAEPLAALTIGAIAGLIVCTG